MKRVGILLAAIFTLASFAILLSACGQSAAIEESSKIELATSKQDTSAPIPEPEISSESVTETKASIPTEPFTAMYTRALNSWWNAETDAYSEEFGSISGMLIDRIGIDEFEAWLREFNALNDLPADGTYRNRDELNIITFVREFRISREYFKAVSYNEFYKFYTEEVIDAVYSDDVAAINKAFANPYALYHDGKIYTFRWINEQEAADYAQEKLTAETLKEYLVRVKSHFTNAKYEDTEENIAFAALEQKVSRMSKRAMSSPIKPNRSCAQPVKGSRISASIRLASKR